MVTMPSLEYPQELQPVRRKARRLAWWTVAYLISVGIVLYLVLGTSQAMKAAWLEDLLSIVPPLVYLVGDRIAAWKPSPAFPYGFHRVTSMAFLAASGALFVLGLWLLLSSAIDLIRGSHPTIGLVSIFGFELWLGWLMIAALVYSGVPPIFIGRIQERHARQLHDKVLYAGASMRKADWLTSSSAIVGILGIGLGLWWADATAAIIISLDVLRDGWLHLKTAVGDLIDRRPTTIDGHRPSELQERVESKVRSLDWVADAEVRLREDGHLVSGEIFLVPRRQDMLPARIEAAINDVKALDWRIGRIAVTPLPALEREP